MAYAFSNLTVADIVREKLSRARVFDHYKIDFYCLGDRSLSEACLDAGVKPREVCTELIAHDAVADEKDETAWDSASVHALVTHIVDHHHRFLRTELPRLVDLLDRAVEAHRAEHPELEKIQEIFLALEQELKTHMTQEEQVLFPIVQQLEEAQTTQQPLPQFHCGSVNNPIRSMEREHTNAADLLRELRRLTGGYRPSTDTCDAYRELLSGMKQLEADLHVHIHKENNILFLKASDLEAALSMRA